MKKIEDGVEISINLSKRFEGGVIFFGGQKE
jgi:hypothetical protein